MGETIELTAADGHRFGAYQAGPDTGKALVVVQDLAPWLSSLLFARHRSTVVAVAPDHLRCHYCCSHEIACAFRQTVGELVRWAY